MSWVLTCQSRPWPVIGHERPSLLILIFAFVTAVHSLRTAVWILFPEQSARASHNCGIAYRTLKRHVYTQMCGWWGTLFSLKLVLSFAFELRLLISNAIRHRLHKATQQQWELMLLVLETCCYQCNYSVRVIPLRGHVIHISAPAVFSLCVRDGWDPVV